jgi:hypothetical protein
MKQNRKLKSKKRVKRKEAELMGFKLMLRECKTNFTDLTDELEKIARDVFYS